MIGLLFLAVGSGVIVDFQHPHPPLIRWLLGSGVMACGFLVAVTATQGVYSKVREHDCVAEH